MKRHVRPETEAARLARELYAEREHLSGLVRETEYTVGRIAAHGFKELNKLPPARHSPAVFTAPGYVMYGDRRYFKARVILREAELSQGLVPMPENDAYAITKTSTEVYKRMHHYRGGATLSLPGATYTTNVSVREIGSQRSSWEDTKFTIGTRGTAYHNLFDHYTAPQKDIGDPASRDYNPNVTWRQYYGSLDHLRNDYAAGYSGALAVAKIVASSLEAAHGITTDTASISPLIDAWQDVAASEHGRLSEDIAVFLPANS